MKRRNIGSLAADISILSAVVQVVPDMLLSRWVARGVERRLFGTIGTMGEVATLLRIVVETSGPLVPLLLGIALGYYGRKHIDGESQYRPFLRSVGIGSAAGVAVTWAVMMALWSSIIPLDVGGAVIVLASLLQMFLTVFLVVLVGAFAGLSLTQFLERGRTSNTPRRT